MVVERFAPSPTGLLHIGHAFSAWAGWFAARRVGGDFLIRIEDLDTSRIRPEFETAIFEDLAWLGLDWGMDVLRQSDRRPAYDKALASLDALGLTYSCTCTRRDIAQAVSAPQEGAIGPDGPIYPGTCRNRSVDTELPHAIRLNMSNAIEHLGGATAVANLSFMEVGEGPQRQSGTIPLDPDDLITRTGDVVLCRRDGAVAYHLAVVVDDAFQGITHVTRGSDLFAATHIHRLLQALLDLPPPAWRHHRLVRDPDGKRLAKRDDARAIATWREEGHSAAQVRTMAGIPEDWDPR